MASFIKATSAAAMLAALATVAISPSHAGHQNPVDLQSNPEKEKFQDAHIHPTQLDKPFIRDGVVIDTAVFKSVTAGLPQERVEALLGKAVTQEKREWDYNFKFSMPQSTNFLVCQYKVTFDKEAVVKAATWRRRQCAALAN